jgi:hypothetical protein
MLRTSRTDVCIIATAALLAIASMFSIRHGDVAGWWLLTGCGLAAAFVVLKPYLPSLSRHGDSDTLDISTWGVRRVNDDGLHEAVSWADLTEVAVVTTVQSLDDEDVHIVLRGHDQNGVVIPHTLAVESGILTQLEMRLNEFDSQAFLDAIMSAADSVFVLWRAPLPKKPAQAAPHPYLHLKAAS